MSAGLAFVYGGTAFSTFANAPNAFIWFVAFAGFLYGAVRALVALSICGALQTEQRASFALFVAGIIEAEVAELVTTNVN